MLSRVPEIPVFSALGRGISATLYDSDHSLANRQNEASWRQHCRLTESLPPLRPLSKRCSWFFELGQLPSSSRNNPRTSVVLASGER